MEAPDFWNDTEASTKKMKELKSLKDDCQVYSHLEELMDDIATYIELAEEENDPEMLPEIEALFTDFDTSMDNIRVKTLLSGEYDANNAIVGLHAGAGGTEACDWVSMLYRMYTRWAQSRGYEVEVLDYLDGEEAGIKSVTFQVNGGECLRLSEVGEGRPPAGADFAFQRQRQASDILCLLRCDAGD